MTSGSISFSIVFISKNEHIFGSSEIVESLGFKEKSQSFKEKKMSFDFTVICLTLQRKKQITVDNDKSALVSILLVLQFASVLHVIVFT